MKKKFLFVLLMLATALLLACSQPTPPAEPIRAVKVITVGTESLSYQQEYAAEVRAQVESPLSFRVAGKIIQRPVDAGQQVKAGQLLAQLDPQDYTLSADAARAQVAAAATNRDLAAADFARYKALKEQNFISGAELERRETTLKAAQAQWAQAQAQLAVQGNQAAYTRLLAPANGVVTAVQAEPGQVVAAGAAVLRWAQDGPRDAVFAVPEDQVAALQVGAAARIRLWAQKTVLPGRVREVAASSDPVTRTYAVKVLIDSPQAPPLGATVSVLPQSGVRSATGMKLPTTALRQEGANSAVWVVDKNTMTVRSQVIQLQTADGNEAVVASGLQPGMWVVSAGVHVLSPGQKVTIYQQNTAVAQ